MERIYKYELSLSKGQVVKLPLVQLLDIQMQHGVPCLWAIVDPNEKEEVELEFNISGTGFSPEGLGEYFCTVQDGLYVWHFFYKLISPKDKT